MRAVNADLPSLCRKSLRRPPTSDKGRTDVQAPGGARLARFDGRGQQPVALCPCLSALRPMTAAALISLELFLP